jgi:uncharacterized protein YbaR (Trm112 family)
VFIELTDHLRCPAPHDESFLVLIPYEMDGRDVVQGMLGCPICRREYRIDRGEAVFELDGRSPTMGKAPAENSVDAGAVAAFLGLEGPGGYVALFGSAGRFATGLVDELPGVHFVLLNPPEGTTGALTRSILRGVSAPIKSRVLRGTVLGADVGSDPHWQDEAARCTLPGLRITGAGSAPEIGVIEVLGEAGGWWVARRMG